MNKFLFAFAIVGLSAACAQKPMAPPQAIAQPEATIRKPAAAGSSELPASQTPLRLFDDESGESVRAVLQNFQSAQTINLSVKDANNKFVAAKATILRSGRFEPDAPTPTNVLLLSTGNYSEVIDLGPILISKIEKIGKSQLKITGSGGYWHSSKDSEDNCAGTVRLYRTLNVDVSLNNDYILKATYGANSDKKVCE